MSATVEPSGRGQLVALHGRVRIALVIAAGVLTIPALLAALDRSAAFSNVEPAVGGERRSIEGKRREAAALLAAKKYDAAVRQARLILARQPLDRTALRLLAMANEGLGRPQVADDIAAVASFVSWRDPYAERRLFLAMAERGKIEDAARRADALSRLTGSRTQGLASLNLLLLLPGGVDAVAARLATRPPWRGDYFSDGRHGLALAPQKTIPLLRALARTGAPATPAEIDKAMAFLVAVDLGPEAWAYWRDTRRLSAGALMDDPDFQAVRVQQTGQIRSPFAWSIPADALVRVLGSHDAEGAPALQLEAGGDRSGLFVSRRLIIPAGRYRLSYRASGEANPLERLHADVRCTAGVQAKAEPVLAPHAAGSSTSNVSEVTIPENCGPVTLGFTLETSEFAAPATFSISQVALRPSSG